MLSNHVSYCLAMIYQPKLYFTSDKGLLWYYGAQPIVISTLLPDEQGHIQIIVTAYRVFLTPCDAIILIYKSHNID